MRLKMMGGGDSTDYDALTAIAEKVVEGLIFLGAGSDEQQAGTLPDMEQMRDSPGYSSDEPESPIHNAEGVAVTTDTNGDSRIALIPPWGRYPGDKTAWVGCYPDDIGIVAAAIAIGQSIAGVEGDYGSDGNLAAKDLRAGKIGYGANGRVVGGATDYGAVSKTIGAGESYTINEGIYSAGKVTAKTLASQTSATAIAAYILKGYTAYVNGEKVTGTMENIAAINTAKSATRSTGGTSGSGLYIRMDAGAHITNASSGYPEVYLSDSDTRTAAGLTAALLAYGKTCLGLTGTYKPTFKQLSAIACFGFGSTDTLDGLSEEESYTCTAAGTCYYNGMTASYGTTAPTSTEATCEIYKNSTLVDSRNIDANNNYRWRTSMVTKSFSVAKGDVIKVVASITKGSSATRSRMSFIDATIVCYA